MAIDIKHKFNSPKGDGTDATLIRPSNWNDTHKIEMAASKLIGRLTAGPGAAEELPITTYMANLLATADYAALALLLGLPTTGDARLTYKGVAPAGWVLANDGSIGDATSNATARNHADTVNLFTFFYDFFSDTWVPLQTQGGSATTRVAQGTAAVAFAAHCKLVLPRQLGRALIIAGTGSGLTNRVSSSFGGAETHTLAINETPWHDHNFSLTSTGSGSGGAGCGSGTASVSGSFSGNTGNISADHSHTFSGTTGSMNRSNPHSHPYTATALNAGTGTSPNYFYSGATSANTGNTDINHEHGFSGTTSGVSSNHTHAFSGSVSSSGSIQVNSISVSVSVSGSGVTGGANGALNQPHNNMMPWTAWNVMIRL